MNKKELIEALQEDKGLSRAYAQKVVELFFDAISGALAKGDRVEIRGLCTFFIKRYQGYTGRNPRTGDLVDVETKKLPFFKPGLNLKNRVDR